MSEAWRQWEGHVVHGDFQLKKYLGGSEQSAVFLTEGPGQTPHPRAIKLVACDPANIEVQLSRWGQAQKLSYPNLVRIFHIGRCWLGTRELAFAVMEYAEENLAQVLPERPLTLAETRGMLEPVLDTLGYLHGQGFLHGRLKPANVLAVNDQLKLSSDGIVRAGETICDPDKSGDLGAPEMSNGVRSPASDVWSLGMLLVQVLTQRLPAWGKYGQADPVVPVNLPKPFLEIARGSLRCDPEQRWTIAAIAAALHMESPRAALRVAAAATLPQRPQPVKSNGRPWIWRSAFPLAVLILGIAALFVGFGFLHRQPEAQPGTAMPESKSTPVSQEPIAAKPSPTTRSKASQRSSSDGSDVSVSVPPLSSMSPQPASLRSAAQPSRNGGSANGVVRQVLPNVPQRASDTIEGTVRVTVRVNVDSSGNVVGAELDSAGPSKYFARLSLEAAQSWKFASSSQAGEREYILHFDFRNAGPTAFATRVGS